MSKPGKHAKKDSAAGSPTADAGSDAKVSMTVTYISDLLEQHQAALAADFKSSFANLDIKLDNIQAIVSGPETAYISLVSDFTRTTVKMSRGCELSTRMS